MADNEQSQQKILIISVGTSPQVVTETVWALLNPDKSVHGAGGKNMARFVPDIIHLITTKEGKKVFKEELLTTNGPLDQLFNQENYQKPKVEIHLPESPDGKKYSDIRTQEENAAFANTITRIGYQYAKQDNTIIHVSLAGGRKTMSYYAGAAISLFGRPQDQLSHILLNPGDYEYCRDFWWPEQKNQEVTDSRTKEKRKACDAKVELCLIPYIKLSPLLKPEHAFPNGKVDFDTLIHTAQQSVSQHKAVLVLDEHTVIVGEHKIKMGPQQFAFYRLLTEALRSDWPGAGPDGIGKDHRGWLTYKQLLQSDSPALKTYFEYYDAAIKGDSTIADKFSEKINELLNGNTPRKRNEGFEEAKKTFQSIKASTKNSFKNLPHQLKNIFEIKSKRATLENKNTHASYFGLAIDKNQIEIVQNMASWQQYQNTSD